MLMTYSFESELLHMHMYDLIDQIIINAKAGGMCVYGGPCDYSNFMRNQISMFT